MRTRWFCVILCGMALGTIAATAARGQGPLPDPAPIPEKDLGPVLPTHPVRRTEGGFLDQLNGRQAFNERWVDASLLPRDKQGIWVLDFAFRPIRVIQMDIEGKGRRYVHYLYYQVINRTGKPRMFVPQFTIVTDTQQRIEDTVLPKAVTLVQAREDPAINLLGAVNIMGIVPLSTKQGIDDAVFGVAVWEGVDPNADKFSVYVRGLSDGYQEAKSGDDKPVTRHKTLRIDFIRRGDKFQLKDREIQLLDPPFDRIYW